LQDGLVFRRWDVLPPGFRVFQGLNCLIGWWFLGHA
jgi:hypothetical protein